MKKTVTTFAKAKAEGEKLTMLTAYDYSTAKLIDAAGVDSILVGDSLGNVMLGYEDTLSVTMEDMIHHGAAVARGAKEALVVIDMPFMSYQTSVYDAVVNAGVPVETTYRNAITLSEEDINLLATIVTLESGGESYDGQLAVANVIINRMNSGHWGSTVADVVYAPYQFSCTSSPMLDYYLANGAQESARQATLEALSGVNNIGNYMCFRAIYVTDLEAYSVYSVIGNHVFH